MKRYKISIQIGGKEVVLVVLRAFDEAGAKREALRLVKLEVK